MAKNVLLTFKAKVGGTTYLGTVIAESITKGRERLETDDPMWLTAEMIDVTETTDPVTPPGELFKSGMSAMIPAQE